MRDEDVLLSSFPRSGNTWVRLLLCNLISLYEWEGKTVDFPLLNKTMPELGINNLLEPWPHPTIPRVVKTHSSYSPLFRKTRSLGIIRDPLDVMVSYYHFQKHRLCSYVGSFSEFIRHRRFGLESWFRHYTSWRDHWTLVVRYEDLRADTFREVSRILDMLAVDYPEDMVCEAVRRSSIENVRAVEKPPLASGNKEARFARNGRTQQWVSYFSEQGLRYYCELADKYAVNVYVDVHT